MSSEVESPAARRWRFIRAIRSLSCPNAAAGLLQDFELLVRDEERSEQQELAALIRGLESLEADDGPVTVRAGEPVQDDDDPTLLSELESLPDHEYDTLLEWALNTLPPPSFGAATMRAVDLLESRRRTLIGWLAQAAEEAFELGDAGTARRMGSLCSVAVVRLLLDHVPGSGTNERTVGDA
jgi:hypothetical protein